MGDGPGADSGGPGIGATSGNMGWDNAGAPVGEAGSPGWDMARDAALGAQAQANANPEAGYESGYSTPAFGFESAIANGTFGGINSPGMFGSPNDYGGGVFGSAGPAAGMVGQGHLGSQLNGFTGFLGSPAMSALNMAIGFANPALGAVVGAGRGLATGNPVAAGLSLAGGMGGTLGNVAGTIGGISGLSGMLGGQTIDSALGTNSSTAPGGAPDTSNASSGQSQSSQTSQTNGGYSGPSSYSGPSGSGSPLAELLARA